MEDMYSEFIRLRTYARFLPEEGRRETWTETVDRYCDFIFNETKNCQNIPPKTKKKIRDYMLTKGVMASMRLVWSAGENARRDNIAAYGCSGFCSSSLDGFGEAMYIELAGTGVGFSVEAKWLDQLPEIKKQRNLPTLRHVVGDSRLGWKKAVDFGIQEWFSGRDSVFDYSQVRPAGAPLKTSGGYASGPEPLARCLEFLRETIIGAQGRKLKSIEVFDMMCEIGSAVVCGGVRRTAMICLCDVDDEDMQNAKQGNFHPRRYMANISAVYRKKPDVLGFTQEFIDMAKSGSGERGIFNLVAARKRSPKRRDKNSIVISNPCGETLLRDMGLCNLTEVVIRVDDDFDSVTDKIRTATWMGCIQSTLTYFPNLRPEWTKNAEEERLLGVSLTGLCDNFELITPETLRHWKNTAIKTAKQASTALGINMPAAITLGKPSGSISQFVDCSAGMHSRWSPYYLRRVRISMHDELFKMMVNQGMPYELDKGNHDTAIFAFPMRSPQGAKTREQDTAIGQLEWYRMLVENWAEQNMSCTIFVKDDEWLDVIAYVYKHFDTINGIAFFPYENKAYAQAPYEDISEIEYHRLVKEMPAIDFSKLCENVDTTTGSREFACLSATSCEI